MVRKVPDKAKMQEYLTRGLTQKQIAEEWQEETGIEVSRSAIAMAIERYQLRAERPGERYLDTLPWKLRPEHRFHTDARYLRLEGRRRRGLSLTDDQLRRLTAWLTEIDRLGAVIVYDPDTDAGFWWMKRTKKDLDIVRP